MCGGDVCWGGVLIRGVGGDAGGVRVGVGGGVPVRGGVDVGGGGGS